jgi:hypothetical protein
MSWGSALFRAAFVSAYSKKKVGGT